MLCPDECKIQSLSFQNLQLIPFEVLESLPDICFPLLDLISECVFYFLGKGTRNDIKVAAYQVKCELVATLSWDKNVMLMMFVLSQLSPVSYSCPILGRQKWAEALSWCEGEHRVLNVCKSAEVGGNTFTWAHQPSSPYSL